MIELEHFFHCPYCDAEISMLLDLSVSKQQYVEDCEVCCNPVQVQYQTDGEALLDFSAQSIEQ